MRTFQRMSGTILPHLTEGSRFAGAVDYLDVRRGIRGWALEITAPGQPVLLHAVCAGTRLAETFAVMPRPELDKAARRITRCGFIMGWSRFDSEALASLAEDDPDAPIEIVLASTGQPIPVVCAPILAGQVQRMVAASPVGDLVDTFRDVNDYLVITRSGLFDTAWYRRQHGAAFDPAMPPLLDYITRGEAEGARPNLYFDPTAYAAAADLPSAEGALLHYIRHSAAAGVAPSIHFDEAFYRRQYRIPRETPALAHYLAHRDTHAPNPWFDRAYYAEASGQRDAADLYEHFATIGAAQGLLPAARFAREGRGRRSLPPEAIAYLETIQQLAAAEGPAASPAIQAAADAGQAEPPPPPAPPPSESLAEPPGEVLLATRIAAPPRGKAADAPTGAARVGFAETEAQLRALAPDELARLLMRAERDLEGPPPLRADAALTLAIGRALAGDRLGAARATVVFLATPVEIAPEIRAEVEQRLLLANHALHEERRGEEALAVYRQLHQLGRREFLTALRLLEHALDAGDAATAAPLVQELETEHARQLNVWALLAIGRFYLLRGDSRRNLQILRSIAPFPAHGVVPEAIIAHRLIEAGAPDDAAARLDAVGETDAAEILAVRFRLAVRRSDIETLLRIFEDPRARRLPDWQLAEAMFLLTVPGKMAVGPSLRLLRLLYRLLEARGLEHHGVVQARIHYLLHNKRWDDLGVLFQELEGTPFSAERETLLRKLEYHCYADNADGAEAIYRETFQGTALNKWESITILRLLSELKRWDEAGRVILDHVANGYGFGAASHVAMRVVRKATVHQAILDRAAQPRPADAKVDADLAEFLTLVQEDAAIVQTARALTVNFQATHRGARYRSNWILPTGEGTAAEQDELCVFLCTNQRYFLSLLTFLCSYLGQSPQMGGRIFVFLDRDVPRHWYGSVAMVAARFNRPIDVVSEPEFLSDEIEHRASYGFFAGGSNLSRAAYFRLYAARYLLDKHSFRRAVYIDTDTVCRSDLSDLLALDLGDKLLAVRVEDYSLEVINAAARNNLDPHAYFNSGVILFKFDDPGLRRVLDESIRISEVEPERLVFHDQCALNIAFAGRVADLPERFNFFLRPSRERNGHIEDGVILHFLDKPKPWDIVFDRTYREEWRVWALVLGSILPQGLFVDIFAAANRD
jgi:lipopolysaccharide biosynthesis glycosyltransferase